jgi:hypothetical protein
MLKAAGTWNAAYDTWSGKHGVTTSQADGLVAAQRRRRLRDLQRRAGPGHQLVLGRRDLTERGTRGTASR